MGDSNQDPVTTRLPPMLLKMANERIFSIRKNGDKFEICENCDECFDAKLTADELRQLGKEIMEMADARI